MNAGKPSQLSSSYRPISLLSFSSKVTEKIILKRLDHRNQEPSPYFGARLPEKARLTPLILSCCRELHDNMNRRRRTAAVFPNMRHAFIQIGHDGLVKKLIRLCFPGYFIKVIQSFLSGRSFQVRVGKEFSGT